MDCWSILSKQRWGDHRYTLSYIPDQGIEGQTELWLLMAYSQGIFKSYTSRNGELESVPVGPAGPAQLLGRLLESILANTSAAELLTKLQSVTPLQTY